MTTKTARLCQVLTIFVILTMACLPSGSLWGQAAVPTNLPVSATPSIATTIPTTAFESPTSTSTPTSLPPITTIQRVVILSIDGLRPDAIELAPMTNLLALMQAGAYTLNARTIFPSSTLPSHASMLTGTCPSKHGVTWNDYLPENGYARGTDLFDLAHAAGLKTVMYVGKEKLRQVTEPASTDIFQFINDRDTVIMDQLLADFLADFGLLFIHFPTADMMGHEHGWLSPEQLSVLFRADQALGNLLDALDSYGLRDSTLIIVTADHGGHGTTHGTNLPEDMTIPWIISGPGIKLGQLSTPVETMDTAATAAFALGLPIPPEWDGRPVMEAFGLQVQAEEAVACQ